MSILIDINGYAKDNNGKKYIILKSGKLMNILDEFASKNDKLYKLFFKEKGVLKSFINLYYNGRIIKENEYDKLLIKDGERLKFIIPLGGG